MGAAPLLSFADFEQLPDTPGKQELMDGELFVSLPAKHSRTVLLKKIRRLLEIALGEPSVWVETGYHIGNGWLQPDVSVSWPDQKIVDDYFVDAPRVAIEVVSRSNTAEEIDRKVQIFLENGAEEVWTVYPKRRSMTVYCRNRETTFVDREYRSERLGVAVELPDLLRE